MKPDTEDNILCDSIYMNAQQKDIQRDRKQTARGQKEGEMGMTANQYDIFWGRGVVKMWNQQ